MREVGRFGAGLQGERDAIGNVGLALQVGDQQRAFMTGAVDPDRDVVERAGCVARQCQLAENAGDGGGQRRLERFAQFCDLRNLSGHGEVEARFVAEAELAFQLGADQVGLQLDFDGRGDPVHRCFRVLDLRFDVEFQVIGEAFGLERQRLVERLHVGREVEVAERLDLLLLAVVEGDMALLDANIAQRGAHRSALAGLGGVCRRAGGGGEGPVVLAVFEAYQRDGRFDEDELLDFDITEQERPQADGGAQFLHRGEVGLVETFRVGDGGGAGFCFDSREDADADIAGDGHFAAEGLRADFLDLGPIDLLRDEVRDDEDSRHEQDKQGPDHAATDQPVLAHRILRTHPVIRTGV